MASKKPTGNKPPTLQPQPDAKRRKRVVDAVRKQAAEVHEQASDGQANTDHTLPGYPATFTKGLPHDTYGRPNDQHVEHLFDFLNQSRPRNQFEFADTTGASIPLGPAGAKNRLEGSDRESGLPDADPRVRFVSPEAAFGTETEAKVRRLESPLAGHVYDLQGPDAAASAIAPAPAFGSDELTFEMAEVYLLALNRDQSFATMHTWPASVSELNKLPWIAQSGGTDAERCRRAARLHGKQTIDHTVAFRGSTPGSAVGPYISQFLLIGNTGRGAPRTFEALRQSSPTAPNDATKSTDAGPVRPQDGLIQYGTQVISQKSQSHLASTDFMTRWATWLDVQNGAALDNTPVRDKPRFLTTPRDLATYVHFDQLYQAYLNAALILLGYQYPFDPGLPEQDKDDSARQAFATFGGPHLLALVTEVSSRALKAVRRTKFQRHLRARPEAIAGVLCVAANEADQLDAPTKKQAKAMLDALSKTDVLTAIAQHNKKQNEGTTADEGDWIEPDANYLLPMAFSEGSPTHGSYGAGHATVAGACVTVLKAFFDMYEAPDSWTQSDFSRLYTNFLDRQGLKDANYKTVILGEKDGHSGLFHAVAGKKDETHLEGAPTPNGTVTLLGELDKLAANISIGRNMAGVHYYSDYYESLRLGERVAVGILLEQMVTYPEPVRMRLTTFDGYRMTLSGDGTGRAKGCHVHLTAPDGSAPTYAQWQRGGTQRCG